MGHSLIRKECGVQPRDFFLDDFCQFLETNVWSSKTEFLKIANFRLRVIGPCMSRREIKSHVWKYTRPILMGLGAVLVKRLDNQNRALRLYPVKGGVG